MNRLFVRTVSQGHPDYRFIEHEKYRLVKERFPLLASYMLVDTGEYVIEEFLTFFSAAPKAVDG